MQKIFYGWWVVLATSLIHFWGAGTFFYSFTAFFNPLVNEFGWSYAATSFAASLRIIEGGIASPLIGWATDRFGARRLLLLGSILGGTGFVLLSLINSLWNFYLVYIFISIGSSLVFPVPGWTAVTNWFDKRRGIALGILSGAIGLGGGLVYGVNASIDMYGWRATLVIIGIGMWVIGIPCSLIVRHDPEQYGLLPDGEKPEVPVCSSSAKASVKINMSSAGFSLGEAMKTRAFWGIALASTVSVASIQATVVHIMPYLISLQFSRGTASLVASWLVFVSIAGRFGFGLLSNRMENRYLLALGIALQALGLLCLALTKDIWLAALFVIVFGTGFGGVITMRLTIQAQYFGRRAFGSIQGALLAIVLCGSIISPLLAGICFDYHGSYRLAWFVLMAICLAVVPLALKIKQPQKEPAAAAKAAGLNG